MGRSCDALMFSMVIDNPYFELLTVFPAENNPPLLIDPNAPETSQVAPKDFQPVSRRNGKVLDNSCLIDHSELPPRPLLDVVRQFANPEAPINVFSVRIAEALNHSGKLPFSGITASVIREKGEGDQSFAISSRNEFS